MGVVTADEQHFPAPAEQYDARALSAGHTVRVRHPFWSQFGQNVLPFVFRLRSVRGKLSQTFQVRGMLPPALAAPAAK